jgi:serine/threonine protein kinase
LGEGGFGQVYLAYDTLNKRKVAVKILSSNEHPSTPFMMNKEIEALAKLKHRHIVKMYNSFPLPKKQQVIVVMEYLEGGELQEYWYSKPNRIVSEEEAKEIML